MRPDALPAQTPTRLADYRPPDWLVERVGLVFDLSPSATRVQARIAFRRENLLECLGERRTGSSPMMAERPAITLCQAGEFSSPFQLPRSAQ